jgi:hypothetical protein
MNMLLTKILIKQENVTKMLYQWMKDTTMLGGVWVTFA